MAINQSLRNLLKGSLVGAGVAICAAAPAQAASFSQFTFGSDTTYSGDATVDIMLNSVTKTGSSNTITNFNLVNAAVIRENEDASATQLGAGSSDAGDNATGVVNEKPSNADVVASLGNLNLNNIIDTEDKKGKSVFDVTFDAPVNTFYFFERGLNSDLHIEALDSMGNVIQNTAVEIKRDWWTDAGYQIDTTEIAAAQSVGSYGLKFGREIAGLRISSFGIDDNGPDYKVVAAKTPEASSMAALGMVAGSMLLLRLRRKAA